MSFLRRRYDCDFNQQLDLGLAGLSVFDVESLDDEKLRRAAGDLRASEGDL